MRFGIPVGMPTMTHVKHFIFGFIIGYIVDYIAMYVYVNFIPAENRFSIWGVPLDDLFVFGMGAVFLFKKPAFGLGYIIAAAASSANVLPHPF